MKVSIVSRNAELDALGPLMNSGKLRIYAGAQPATPETAPSGALLGELTLNATAFGAASGGVITANAITSDLIADNTGTAGWFRVVKSDGTTAVLDGTVGTSGSDLNLNSVAIQAAAQIDVTSLVITLPT